MLYDLKDRSQGLTGYLQYNADENYPVGETIGVCRGFGYFLHSAGFLYLVNYD